MNHSNAVAAVLRVVFQVAQGDLGLVMLRDAAIVGQDDAVAAASPIRAVRVLLPRARKRRAAVVTPVVQCLFGAIVSDEQRRVATTEQQPYPYDDLATLQSSDTEVLATATEGGVPPCARASSV